MKILEAKPVLLSNAEVLAHINSVSARPQPSSRDAAARSTPRPMKSPNFETVVKEVRSSHPPSFAPACLLTRIQLTDYLDPPTNTAGDASAAAPTVTEEDPGTSHPLPPYDDRMCYAPERIRAVMQRLERFRLTEAELFMIVNLRPREAVVLDVIVEEIDNRFSEEQQADMLEIIGEELGG